MVTNLLRMEKSDKAYSALQYNGRLFRIENNDLGIWKLYGGAYRGDEFDMFEVEALDYDRHRPAGYIIQGTGNFAGKSLKEIACVTIQPGHSLIVSPISSPRAKEKGFDKNRAVVLSGYVKSIEQIPEIKNLDDIFKSLRN